MKLPEYCRKHHCALAELVLDLGHVMKAGEDEVGLWSTEKRKRTAVAVYNPMPSLACLPIFCHGFMINGLFWLLIRAGSLTSKNFVRILSGYILSYILSLEMILLWSRAQGLLL